MRGELRASKIMQERALANEKIEVAWHSVVDEVLGDEFVTLYAALKDDEYREFQEIITPYEREILMFNV